MQKLTGALAKVGGIIFPGGGRITGILGGVANVTPPSLATLLGGTSTMAVPGARVGDMVSVEPPAALEVGLVVIGAAVTAANVVTINFYNPTASTITGVARSWGYRVLRAS
jgi:hypothetical protein